MNIIRCVIPTGTVVANNTIVSNCMKFTLVVSVSSNIEGVDFVSAIVFEYPIEYALLVNDPFIHMGS